MQTYFSGRMLSAESFAAEQTYVHHHRSLGKAAALERPPPRGSHEALIASLPPSILDEVALNPQPLPPRDGCAD